MNNPMKVDIKKLEAISGIKTHPEIAKPLISKIDERSEILSINTMSLADQSIHMKKMFGLTHGKGKRKKQKRR